MKDSVQLGLNGEPLNQPIEFDCPICKKQITLDKDEKGNVYHRPWVFHFMYDHANKHPKEIREMKDHLSFWLYYYACSDGVKQELIEDWKKKIGE